MRKFDLTFLDKKIEDQYQKELYQNQRSSTFRLITIGLLITFFIKLIFSLLHEDNKIVYFSGMMMVYLIAQYIFISWKQHYVRFALIVTNISLIGLYMNKEQSSEIANLRGSNLMAANLMIILSGEFLDSVIEVIVLTILKIIFTFQDNALDYPVIVSSVLVNISFLYYVYLFHKGRRSQFLLGLVETGWDQIFFQLIKDPCILLEFNHQNLSFQIKKFKKLPFSQVISDTSSETENKEQQIQSFLQNSHFGKTSLSQHLYECIKIFSHKHSRYFQKQFSIKFQKQIILIDLTIFQTKSPMILLKMQKKPEETLKHLRKYRKKFILLNNAFLNLLFKIESEIQNNIIIKQMRRKLMIVKIMEDMLNNSYQFNFVNIAYIISQLQNLYPDKILIFQNVHNMQNIHTIPNAFFLLLLSVMEYSVGQIVQLKLINLELEQCLMLEFQGTFKQTQIKKVYENTHYQNRLILSDVYFSQNLTQFILYFDPLCSTIEDIYTYEYQDLLLSNDL